MTMELNNEIIVFWDGEYSEKHVVRCGSIQEAMRFVELNGTAEKMHNVELRTKGELIKTV